MSEYKIIGYRCDGNQASVYYRTDYGTISDLMVNEGEPGAGFGCKVALTADVVIFWRLPESETDVQVPFVKRSRYPFAGYWALPGDKLGEEDLTIEAAAQREVKEETGFDLAALDCTFRLVDVYSQDRRDPRQSIPRLGEQPSRSVSVAYWTVLDADAECRAGDDASFTQTVSDRSIPCLAFDYERILIDAFCHYQDVLDESEAPYVL
jgi:ADP-ribose pyrophosphatase YjhB (NUDIX family)